MPRYKSYDYDQMLMVPVSLDQQLMPGTLEYAIHTLIEERIDTSIFDEKYNNDETGRTAYDPKVLLKLVLFSYSRGMLHPESKRGRQVHYLHGRRPGALTDEMRAKIDTPEGRKIYGKRLAIVEPVFGNIRACKGMDRFTLRGRTKVNIQWTLYCLVHNIGKLANFAPSYAAAL